ncbi:hypothetical protein L3X38_021483 [Prunus dulcis]|uniref:Uncharacterized protein n=1 Tax=Prunus dulcis TaxID=3755 RepID=A0AAD4Z2M2_PRUDU|nr:hypothetical protein L3X38_021483 [Prunus dulcis]
MAAAAAAGKYGNYYDFKFYTLLMTWPNTYCMRMKDLARRNCYEPVAHKFIINGLWPIYNDFNARPKCGSASNAQREFDGEQFKIAETTCVVKMKEYWPNPTVKDLTESKFFWERQWKEHEYGREGIVSTRGDVYSFGIVFMEIFTKRKPTDEMFVGEISLKQWIANSLLSDAMIDEVVDANLLRTEEDDDDDFVSKRDYLSSIMRLALKCSA